MLETFLQLLLISMKSLKVYIAFFVLPLLTYSQNFFSWQFKDRYFSIYVGTGTATYFGELNSKNSINDRFSLFNTGVEARLLSRVGARIDFAYLSLSGSDQNAPSDSYERQRNLSFESNNFHTHFALTYYIKPYSGDYYKRWIFDPYLIGGVGYLQYNPATIFGNERFLLREAKTEGVDYRKWCLTIPFGIGAKWKISEFLNVNTEILYHLAFTDYLDDVSNAYATDFETATSALLSDRKNEVGVLNDVFYDEIKPGSERGNPSTNDSFLLINIKAEIFIPSNLFSKSKKAIIRKSSAY